MRRIRILIGLAACLGISSSAQAAGPGDEVVVVYNTRSAESQDIARHYAEVRNVPSAQVIGLDLPDNENITREDFRERLQKPLWKALLANGGWKGRRAAQVTNNGVVIFQGAVEEAKVRYAVLCYGVPLRILEDKDLIEKDVDKMPAELRRNGAAVDSELSCLPLLQSEMPLTGPVVNNLYGTTNAAYLSPTNGMLLVTRLDGPTAAIARQLVDKAVEAEKRGLWGRAYFDLRGVTNEPYVEGDLELGRGADVCRRVGYETVVDNQPTVFSAGFPLSQIAFYAGWYEANVAGALAEPKVEFVPGAFAYHLQSSSAATLRSTDRNWAGPLLARGAAATMGCVDEPYLTGTPDMGVFFDRFVRCGFTYGEAAYSDQRLLSWQITVIGDPLYRPFAKTLDEWRQEVAGKTNSAAEWVELAAVNVQLTAGGARDQAITTLNDLPLTKTSAVLEEKLAELNYQLRRLDAAAEALKAAVNLKPSPQQRVRLEVLLADTLDRLGHKDEAVMAYQQFLKDHPDTPLKQKVQERLSEISKSGAP